MTLQGICELCAITQDTITIWSFADEPWSVWDPGCSTNATASTKQQQQLWGDPYSNPYPKPTNGSLNTHCSSQYCNGKRLLSLFYTDNLLLRFDFCPQIGMFGSSTLVCGIQCTAATLLQTCCAAQYVNLSWKCSEERKRDKHRRLCAVMEEANTWKGSVNFGLTARTAQLVQDLQYVCWTWYYTMHEVLRSLTNVGEVCIWWMWREWKLLFGHVKISSRAVQETWALGFQDDSCGTHFFPGCCCWASTPTWVVLQCYQVFSIVVQSITFRNVIEMVVDPVFLEHMPCCGGHVHKLFSQ